MDRNIRRLFPLFSVISLAFALLVMALPFSVPVMLGPAPDTIVIQYYSYFHFSLIGWAVFSPALTAVLTLLWLLVSILHRVCRRGFFKPVSLLEAIASRPTLCLLGVLSSIASLFCIYRSGYEPFWSIFITIFLIAALLFQMFSRER